MDIRPLEPPLVDPDGIRGPEPGMEIRIRAIRDVVRLEIAGLPLPGRKGVAIHVDQRAQVVIKVHFGVSGRIGVVPLHGLRDLVADEPFARWLL